MAVPRSEIYGVSVAGHNLAVLFADVPVHLLNVLLSVGSSAARYDHVE